MSEMVTPPPERSTTLRAFDCPSCGASVTVRATGITITAACSHCGSVIDTADPKLQILQKWTQSAPVSDLDIGDRGTLFGVKWEVIGYVLKSIPGTFYEWDEYLLFNPWQGFRFLSNTNGHWVFFSRINESVPGIGSDHGLAFQDKYFRLYNYDTVRVEALKGEFYWRIKQGYESSACDYICPPFMLSSEEYADERVVSLGTHVPRRDIETAFAVTLPPAKGVGACQPAPFEHSWIDILKVSAAAVALAFILQIATMIAVPSKTVAVLDGPPVTPISSTDAPLWTDNDIGRPATTTGQTLTTAPFHIDRTGAVSIQMRTHLDNAWADFTLTLVNEVTGKIYEARQGLSKYSGYEDGEAWSEGSNRSTAFLSRVPAGDYRLLIDADSDILSLGRPLNFTLKVKTGDKDGLNLLICLIALGLFPIFVLGRRAFFEGRRWGASDYTYYGQKREDLEDA